MRTRHRARRDRRLLQQGGLRRGRHHRPAEEWDEFVADAKLIKAKGVTPFYDMGGDKWATQWWVQAQLADAAKAGLWDQINSNKEKFTDPTIQGAIDNYKDLIDAGPVQLRPQDRHVRRPGQGASRREGGMRSW